MSRQLGRDYQSTRALTQWVIVGYVLLIGVGHSLSWSWAASLHTICPFGGVVNLYTYFSTGGFVAKLHSAVFVMLLALVISLVLTGKSFCGWICPLGTLEEYLGRLGHRLWPRAYDKVPRKLDRILQLGKYAILVWVVVQTARSARLVFEPYDPYYNLFSIWTGLVAWTGYLAVALTLGASLFVSRPFCRWACPLGAINGLFNSFSFLGIKRDLATCIDCGRCDRACPVHIKVSSATTVRSVECMRCLECVEACPVNARTGTTLKVRTWFDSARRRGRTVPAPVFFSVAIAAFVLPIALTMATGHFAITRANVYSSPADIRGSSTLQDVVDNFQITEKALYNGFDIPAKVKPDTKLKDVQTAMGIPASNEVVVPEIVRLAVTYLQEPLGSVLQKTGADATRLPEAIELSGLTSGSTLGDLMEKGAPGSVAYLLTGFWPGRVTESQVTTTSVTQSSDSSQAGTSTSGTGGSGTGGGGTRTGDTTDATTQEIKGTTTLGDMKAKVLDFQAFLAAFKIPASESLSATLKDLAAKYGFEVGAVRTYVAEHAK
jgi:polyferredoxin